MDQSRVLILGSNGQLGKALNEKYPEAQVTDVSELDITNIESIKSYDWSRVDVILNAAAYTNVDGAETAEGRTAAWNVNSQAVKYLSEIASKNKLTLLHISTDYVFNGTVNCHTEEEHFSPLNVYGASKAAGDIAVSLTPKHYIIRTSWVIGEGKNFVRTMLDLGRRGINPTVVSDQVGRLTFTTELVRGIDFLLNSDSHYGVYNLSNSGDPASWSDITRKIYEFAKLDNHVLDISTDEYYSDKSESAKRPLLSTLALNKIQNLGFASKDWQEDLLAYINKELQKI